MFLSHFGLFKIMKVLLLSKTKDEENTIAHFIAARPGWQAGGKIALLDAEGNEYTIIVNRLSRIVELRKGYIELLPIRYRDELPF